MPPRIQKITVKMLVTDHTADYQKLQTLAQQNGFTIPTAIDAEHNKLIGPFQALKGAAFDKKYIHTMVMGHTQALATFKKEADDAQNPALKAFAQDILRSSRNIWTRDAALRTQAAARARLCTFFAGLFAARFRTVFCCGTTERLSPMVFSTATSVLRVGLPLGESER